MNLTTLYPPIAAATVVFILWALVAYRLYKRDLPLGPNNESLCKLCGLRFYPAPCLAISTFLARNLLLVLFPYSSPPLQG